MTKLGNRMLWSLPVVMLVWTLLVWTLLAAPAQAQFVQENPKLVGTGGVRPGPYGVQQGRSVSLSGDGHTQTKASLSRFPVTGIPPSWVGVMKVAAPRGYGRALTGCGPGKRNWSAAVGTGGGKVLTEQGQSVSLSVAAEDKISARPPIGLRRRPSSRLISPSCAGVSRFS
jgi:hypothetical protein